MGSKNKSWSKENINCPICGASQSRKLGIRGNREYFGADQSAEPHIFTDVVQCIICDFIYTNPMIRGLEFIDKEHYNNSEKYQATQDNPSIMFQKRLSFIAKYKKYGCLLDVGAGKGEFLWEARKNGWEAIGVEPSPNLCQFAREHYKLTIYEGFLGQVLDIPKSYFDIVAINHVLEHVDRPYELLKLIAEYLADNGLVFIEVPNADSYFLRIIDFYFKMKGLNWSSRLSPLHPPYHKYGFTEKSLTYLLKQCNYQIIELKTFSGRDRGYQKKNDSIVGAFLPDIISMLINFLGNKELLCVIAKPIK
ncbi:MAG: class I SAM-dependent methyltransferase [Candidatus Omnitrophota bacterium]|mgnify:CR=1 FL=1